MTVGSLLVGIGAGLVASMVFLVVMRTTLTPKIEVSEQMARNFNQSDEEVYRIKLVNVRRSEAVKLHFELVTLVPLSPASSHVNGRKKWFFFGKRKQIAVNPIKYERIPLKMRPETLVSVPGFKLKDPGVSYAYRVTTSDCAALRAALTHKSHSVRFRVYAEHPWSTRGKTFEKFFHSAHDAVPGDFPLGRDGMTVVPDLEIERRLAPLTPDAKE